MQVKALTMIMMYGGSALQISSKLHRQQLVRAMKRVILGLGAVPSSPRDLQCRQVHRPASPADSHDANAAIE